MAKKRSKMSVAKTARAAKPASVSASKGSRSERGTASAAKVRTAGRKPLKSNAKVAPPPPANTAESKPAAKSRAKPPATGPAPSHPPGHHGFDGLWLGSHLSIAGGLNNALDLAERLGFDTVQIFTKNQQQWAAKPLEREAIDRWKDQQSRLGWQGRTVSHASYLINLASPDDTLWRRSIELMRDEIERCEQLGIAYLVHHPGAFTGSSLEAGLARIADAYKQLFASTAGYKTVSCLENTAGAGTTIGRTFEELATLREMILDRTGATDRVGYCIDTCHAHVAGYDMADDAGAARTLNELDRVCGFAHVRVLHLNDSKAPVGSRLDRHEHVGLGTIGDAGFRAVINRQGLRSKPMILETPKADHAPGVAWDSVNRGRLLGLISI